MKGADHMADTSHSTAERAMDAALELFSRKGYDATSMNDIAQAVGIRAPSLYKHFASKEALFTAVAPRVTEHYRKLWQAAGDAQARLAQTTHGPGSLTADKMAEETLAWLDAELAEGQGFRAFARRSPETLRWLWDEPLALYEALFARLMDQQAVKRADAHVMAAEYLAPIFYLVELADRDAGRRNNVEDEVRRHISQFHRAFAVKERPAPTAAPNSGGVRGLFRR